MKDPVLARLQRRLDRLALDQLRQEAARLHDELERTKADLARAQDDAEHWHDEVMMLREAVQNSEFATHRVVGLAKDGGMVVAKLPAEQRSS